jgi:cyclophilin family peptidyl-prolyl cis-trans isomerase/HEAT repeat protein
VAVPGSFGEKISWILRLEDQRLSRDAQADLAQLAFDTDARIRRRSALAMGRVAAREDFEPLAKLLTDTEPEVRQMAAFALGLRGEKRSRDLLAAALGDPSPMVQGGAAEALGLIGDAADAVAIARMMNRISASDALAATPSDDEDLRRDTPIAAFRLGLFALVRLNAFEQIASAVLDDAGQPRLHWWPIAYALQRSENPRAFSALMTLAAEGHPYTRGFAVKGLGPLRNSEAVPMLLPLAAVGRGPLAIQAVRALGRIGDASAAPTLMKLVESSTAEPNIRLEAIAALGSIRAPGVMDLLLDLVSHPSPPFRAAALTAAASVDAEGFIAVLSSLDGDPNWTVRAAVARVLGTLPPEAAIARLMPMLDDEDQRVVPSVLEALVKVKAPRAETILNRRLTADDPVVRAAAASGLGVLGVRSAAPALADAYRLGQRDPISVARSAALGAIAKLGLEAANPVLTSALSDRDWAIRVRAARLLTELDPSSADAVDRQIRPAPTALRPDIYREVRLRSPLVLPHLFIDTDRGTIGIELAANEAPLTTEHFVTLARRGFFNGLSFHRVVPDFVVQTGDPRGDGEGGPGYTVRDEVSMRPYLRGTLGVALEPWPDSGGSQFFITHSPQPHLDAKYTVLGRVVSGMEVVDRTEPWDIVRRVRVSEDAAAAR